MSHKRNYMENYFNSQAEQNLDPYQRAYRQAERKVRARQEFYGHLATYVFVNVMLVAIYLMTTPGGYPWFIWPMFGWGIGIVAHGLSILPIVGGGVNEQRLIEREMARSGYAPGLSQPSAWPTNESRPPYEG